MNSPVLHCQGLCKQYKPGVPVLQDFALTVPPGKILGLLGPNGCGKTTFLKLVAGLLVPNKGEIFICGQPRSEQSNHLISYLPERPSMSLRMRIREMMAYYQDFFPDFRQDRCLKMLGDLGLDPNAQMRTLSKGNKEKVNLILAMSRDARLYLLDEPIGGVDPAARDYILQTIIGNYNPEASVIITTHLISDIEPALDEFAFMTYGGRILVRGSADTVRQERGQSIDEYFREVFRCL